MDDISVNNAPPGGYSGHVSQPGCAWRKLRSQLPPLHTATARQHPLCTSPTVKEHNLATMPGELRREARSPDPFPLDSVACRRPKLSPGRDPGGPGCWQGALVPTPRSTALPPFQLSALLASLHHLHSPPPTLSRKTSRSCRHFAISIQTSAPRASCLAISSSVAPRTDPRTAWQLEGILGGSRWGMERNDTSRSANSVILCLPSPYRPIPPPSRGGVRKGHSPRRGIARAAHKSL